MAENGNNKGPQEGPFQNVVSIDRTEGWPVFIERPRLGNRVQVYVGDSKRFGTDQNPQILTLASSAYEGLVAVKGFAIVRVSEQVLGADPFPGKLVSYDIWGRKRGEMLVDTSQGGLQQCGVSSLLAKGPGGVQRVDVSDEGELIPKWNTFISPWEFPVGPGTPFGDGKEGQTVKGNIRLDDRRCSITPYLDGGMIAAQNFIIEYENEDGDLVERNAGVMRAFGPDGSEIRAPGPFGFAASGSGGFLGLANVPDDLIPIVLPPDTYFDVGRKPLSIPVRSPIRQGLNPGFVQINVAGGRDWYAGYVKPDPYLGQIPTTRELEIASHSLLFPMYWPLDAGSGYPLTAENHGVRAFDGSAYYHAFDSAWGDGFPETLTFVRAPATGGFSIEAEVFKPALSTASNSEVMGEPDALRTDGTRTPDYDLLYYMGGEGRRDVFLPYWSARLTRDGKFIYAEEPDGTAGDRPVARYAGGEGEYAIEVPFPSGWPGNVPPLPGEENEGGEEEEDQGDQPGE